MIQNLCSSSGGGFGKEERQGETHETIKLMVS
jgi:hypothetical protein